MEAWAEERSRGRQIRARNWLIAFKLCGRWRARACLAAINCYSLVDQRYAYWLPERSETPRLSERTLMMAGGKRDYGGHVKVVFESWWPSASACLRIAGDPPRAAAPPGSMPE